MTELTRALLDLVQAFDRLAIPYAVMGGMAVRVYGIPRATYDIDFTAAIGLDRLGELFAAVLGLGYTVPEQYESGWVDRVAGMPLVKFRRYLSGQGVDVDVFLAESPFQQQLLARRRREHIEQTLVWFVSPEDLILLKLLAGRPRDIADVGDILFTQGQLDEKHLRRWAMELGLKSQLEQALRDAANQ